MDDRSGSASLKLRDRLEEGITKELEEVYLNGHRTERLPGNLNLSFAYVEGEALSHGCERNCVILWIGLYLSYTRAVLCLDER